MDTFMFIDDEPYERDEVKSEHPDVRCINASKYIELPSYSSLNPRFITQDSKKEIAFVQECTKLALDSDDLEQPKEFDSEDNDFQF